MASHTYNSSPHSIYSRNLEIRTKSIEQTLVPLVNQITTLVNHREVSKRSERTCRAIERIGQAVNIAVERFVSVGEAIADENEELQEEMYDACREARLAGMNIAKLTDISFDDTGQISLPGDKNAMVRAARGLLSAVTRVLLIGDKVVIKQMMKARSKVTSGLERIQRAKTFSDFVQCFSQFGKEMVELAHVTGDRQNDLKNEKLRAKMASSRSTLEKSTMLLLTSCKACLRHPDCLAAKQARDGVVSTIRQALDIVDKVVLDSPPHSPIHPGVTNGVLISSSPPKRAYALLQEFSEIVESTRVTLADACTREKLHSSLGHVIDSTQDFTDSAYTSHEHRERILLLCEQLRKDLESVSNVGRTLDSRPKEKRSKELDAAIQKIARSIIELKKQLQTTAIEQASEVFHTNEDHIHLTGLKEAGLRTDREKINKISDQFREHSEQLQELCRLLSHIVASDALAISIELTGINLRNLAPQVPYATMALAEYTSSKIAKENLDVFSDAWEGVVNELSCYVEEIIEATHGKPIEKRSYMSLPRPGKHGTTMKSLKPARLDAQEQTNVAKLGLELKLLTAELDVEADKWLDQDNDVIRRARNLSSMAYAIHLFSQGEGSLRNTQDLFKQAEYFAEEGNKLFRCVRDTTFQAPECQLRSDLMILLDRVLSYCQQLLFTTRSAAQGKAATFNKVDSTIQDTKMLLTVLVRILPLCSSLASQYNLPIYRSPSLRSRPSQSNSSSIGESRTSGDDTDSLGSSCNSDGSLKRNHPSSKLRLLHNTHSLDRP